MHSVWNQTWNFVGKKTIAFRFFYDFVEYFCVYNTTVT